MMASLTMPCRYAMKNLPRLMLLTLLMVINDGCILDGDDDCVTKAILYIRVAEETSRASASSDEDQPDVENATVYFFDKDSKLERVVTLTREEIENRIPIEVSVYNGKRQQVVVWGNLNNSQEVSDPTIGMQLSEARIRMLEKEGYALPPDQLFYGCKELAFERVQEVVINQWVGRVSITAHGFKDGPDDDASYYFTIESKYNGYDFYGQPQAGNALLRIEAEKGSNQQEEYLFHQPVNLVTYPDVSGGRQSINVKLYKSKPGGDVLIASADKDMEGNKIVTHNGENTNVLLDLAKEGDLNVYIELTPWEHIYQWAWW